MAFHHPMILQIFLAYLVCCFNPLLAQQTDTDEVEDSEARDWFHDAYGGDNGANLPPSLQDSLQVPQVAASNTNALLTCVVRNLGSHTLLWKYGVSKVLTAGNTRITSDTRFSVLHDEGGDVYVLQILNVTHNDTGLYVCEVNTDPPLRSFHRLSVLTDQLVAPPPPGESDEHTNSTAVEALWGYTTPAPINHNYTQCCQDKNVPAECIGFCSLKNILEGTTGIHPTQCDPFFKNIVSCMADGKNHVPCCERNNIPDICQDMCVGEYTEQTDDVRTHLSCGSFTAPTLACISEGVDTLPTRPSRIDAENITDTSILLRWSLGENSITPIEYFNINMTLVSNLKHPAESKDALKGNFENDFTTKKFKVKGNLRKFTIEKLTPFGLYNITMESVNNLGKSLPSYTLKVLTLSKTEAKAKKDNPEELPGPPKVPQIPDTKQCCKNKNVTHSSCVDIFCDPLELQKVSVPDVIICAPWGKQMFGCVSDHKDHSDCCRRRDIPESCMGICAGENLNQLDYKHFRCVQHMPEIANCMLSGYDVLPSEPRKFEFSNVGTNIGILHWDPPKKHADSISDYTVSYTKIKSGNRNIKETKTALRSPYILEDLDPDSSYEVYVQARNFYGVGEPTTRIVFRTASKTVVDLTKKDPKDGYDQKTCCSRAGVKDDCMPMCQYNASLSQVRKLSNLCKDDLVKVTKCAAGGRDHLPCCYKRGVSPECQMLCQGVQYTTDHSIYTKCLSYIGNIMLCLEEGSTTLPLPVENFHATFVADDRVTLVWDPVKDMKTVDQFEIYYKRLLNNSTPASAFEHEANVNVTTGSSVTIKGLDKDVKYQFFVISRNQFGTSLPSSLIRVNVSDSAWNGKKVEGKPSAPHGIELVKAGAKMLSFAWTAPVISNHDDLIKYRFIYGPYKDLSNINSTSDIEKKVTSVETWSTTVKLFSLEPNTQYIAYIEAFSTKTNQTSNPSETIIAWTDPIIPAFAEPPAVHPEEGLKEGDSMTVLCIALGTPTPTVTLYLGEHPIRSEKTRHMVTAIHNITRDMQTISCYVDNAFGTPMRATRTIKIERIPRVILHPKSGRIITSVGANIRIECEADAWPAPSIKIGRTGSNIDTDRSNVSTQTIGNGVFKTTMVITESVESDSGQYFCYAKNTHGMSPTKNVKVIVSEDNANGIDMRQCCEDHDVQEGCLGICSLNLDLDSLLFDKECIPDFEKIMACGSDGSDHRHCCSNNNVPRDCLDWCRGLPSKGSSELCALDHAKTIAQCFHEGQFTLPGRPQNIRVTPTSATTAVAKWDPPTKNAQFVELYRILWRAQGSVRAKKVDTSRTKIEIEDLQPGVPYELVIKAGNANGTSQLTPPLKFITADEYIVETQAKFTKIPNIVGALLAVVLLVVIIALFIWFYKFGGRKYLPNFKLKREMTIGSAPRSFENPYFNQEVTMSNLQANDVTGHTMTDAISSQTTETNNDDIAMENVETSDESSSNPKKKWPKFPSGKTFNNGFGFQRFQ